MGCQSSIVKLKPNGSFIPTSNPEIDDLYKELDEAIAQLNRQGGPMVVAIDTFVTVTGGSKYEQSTAHGLVATLVVTLAELPQENQLVLMNQYPGIIVDTDRLTHIESLRAWELWRNLSLELLKALTDLDSYLSHALHCAVIPDSISKALTRLSQDSEIRVIDLRKLNIILEANRPVLLDAADSFHRSIGKIKDIASESMAVFEGLKVEELRRALLELSNEAALARVYDPIRVMVNFKSRFEALATNGKKMGFWGHYKVLVWKNWLLWRRHLCVSLCECICPVALICFLLILRISLPAEDKDSKSYLTTSADVGQLLKQTAIFNNYTAPPFGNFDFSSQPPFSWCQMLAAYNWTVGVVGADSPLGAKLSGQLAHILNSNISITPFSSEAELEDYVTSSDYEKEGRRKVCFAVVIDSQSPDGVKYKLRFNATDTNPHSQSVYGNWWDIFSTNYQQPVNKFQRNVNTDFQQQFIESGFMQLMTWVTHFYLQTFVDPSAQLVISFVPMHQMKWVKDAFSQNFGGTIGFFMFISTLIPLTRQIGKITNEKETKIKESMRIMGLTDPPYWLSWYSMYVVIYFTIAVLCTLVSIPIFAHSSLMVVFLMYFLYGLSCIAFSMLIISFFSRAKTAILVGVVVFFVTYFCIFTIDTNTSQSTITGLSIFSTIAMAEGFITMIGLEGTQIGSHFDNLSLNYNNFNVQLALVFLVIDTVVYGLLALYFDRVIPSEFGANLPWYFPVSPSYWKGFSKTDNSLDEESMRVLEEEYQSNITTMQRTRRIEPVDASLLHQQETGQAMTVRGLRKQFGSKIAVDGVDFDMYEGQIFALLGHNGAGKTTTISMLTGLIDPTAGEMTVHGLSFKTNMADIRKELGVCPQHDVLFPDLTVEEHLYMFSVFKGMRDQREIKEKIDQKIAEIDLEEKRETPAKNLSGGQKRKLSLAMALIGGSSIVMLDEPTSGMDLTARRRMWDMLKNEKNKRIIILTTHYMEEADILADRIAIMAEGKVRCVGSPLFLKNRYGVGYNLTIAKQLNVSSQVHTTEVVDFVKQHIPEAVLLYNVSAEIQFQLPLSSTSKFKSFFSDLDVSLSRLQLEQYGISVTTLEEVFLRVARGEGEFDETSDVDSPTKTKEKDRKGQISISMTDLHGINSESITDSLLLQGDRQEHGFNITENRVKGIRFCSHMFALLQKRFWYSIRDLKGLSCEIFLPILVVVAGLALLTQFSVFTSQESYTETVTKYSTPQSLLYNTWAGKTADYSQINAINGIMRGVNSSFPGLTGVESVDSVISLSNFDIEVFNRRFTSPNRMGSYYFYEADDVQHQYQVVIFQNSTAYQAVPTFFSLLSQGLLRHLFNANFTITCVNHPLPLTKQQANLARNTGTFYIAMIFAIGMAFIPTGLVTLIVRERENNVKHQLVVSGVSIPAYWFSYYLWDIFKHMIPAVVCACFIKLFDLKSLTNDQEAYAAVWILFILYGFAVAPFTYLSGFLFKSYSMAQFAVFMFNLVTGAILSTASWMMRLLSSNSRNVNQGLQYVFRLSPIYCFTYGIMNASNREVYATLFGEKEERGALDWQIAGADVIFLLFETVIYTLILFVVEWSRNIQKLRQVGGAKDPGSTKYQPDEDVEREKDEARTIDPSTVAVKVSSLRQIYGGRFSKSTKVAIEDVSFIVHKNECFALLGVNGAGKTSTFRILTGEYVPTSGSAYIGGSSIENEMSEARYKIGYCPQFDALSELLTPMEHLRLYARIKGIPRRLIVQFATQTLESMGLKPYANVKSGTLSGGNKRKLSVAIACIGNPPVVFLDEPSAGMDPEARKKMWKVINEIKSKQTSIILTTHSMEEAEALCDRIAIMVAGRGYELFLKVKGPDQATELQLLAEVKAVIGDLPVITRDRLKACCERLGRGDFEEEIAEKGSGQALWQQLQSDKAVDPESFVEWFVIELNGARVFDWLKKTFRQVTLIEHYLTFYKFKVERDSTHSLGHLFGSIEDSKDTLSICEYSLSQTTLEQIFNMFATQSYETERLSQHLTIPKIGLE